MKQARGLWDDTCPAVACLMLLYVNIEQMLRLRERRESRQVLLLCVFFVVVHSAFSLFLANSMNVSLFPAGFVTAYQLLPPALVPLPHPASLSALRLLSAGIINSIGC